MCHINNDTQQERVVNVDKNGRVSYGSDLLATQNKAVMDWLDPEKHQDSCSDLLFYNVAKNSWRVIAVTLGCKEMLVKCSNKRDIICIPKCCPNNQIVDIEKGSCTKPTKTINVHHPIGLPVHPLKSFECNNSHQDVQLRCLLLYFQYDLD